MLFFVCSFFLIIFHLVFIYVVVCFFVVELYHLFVYFGDWPLSFVIQKDACGVPTMAQWVKNLTAAAQVTAEVWVCSLAQSSGLKDPALL